MASKNIVYVQLTPESEQVVEKLNNLVENFNEILLDMPWHKELLAEIQDDIKYVISHLKGVTCPH